MGVSGTRSLLGDMFKWVGMSGVGGYVQGVGMSGGGLGMSRGWVCPGGGYPRPPPNMGPQEGDGGEYPPPGMGPQKGVPTHWVHPTGMLSCQNCYQRDEAILGRDLN